MNAAMGFNQRRRLESDPLIREYYEDYLACRSTQLEVFRKPTGKRDGSEKIVIVQYPTGFTILPNRGGWHDQSYLTTRLFTAALRGEQAGIARQMAKP